MRLKEIFGVVRERVKKFDAPVLASRSDALAYETVLMSRQLSQRQKNGTDDFSKEHIRGYVQKLNEDGLFCRGDNTGESIVTESNDQNKVFVVTDTGVRLSIEGITKNNLSLVIDGQELAVPNSDPHYLAPMIAREMLRIETGEEM